MSERTPATPSRATASRTGTALHRPLPSRLLGVWAHPDDEAYLSAGLMARVADAGGEVTVVCATRGEKGTNDPARYDRDEFGLLRERELRASLAELGVTDLRLLGFRDGECDLVDDATGFAAVVPILAEVEPDLVVTFGPDGITNHPDHRAVCRWATAAWVAEPSAQLLYATLSDDFAARHRDLHDRLGVFTDFGDGRPRSVDRSRIALECSLDETELDRKRRALAAHDSQTTGLAAAMGEEVYRTWYRDEHFRAPTGAELGRAVAAVGATLRPVGAGR